MVSIPTRFRQYPLDGQRTCGPTPATRWIGPAPQASAAQCADWSALLYTIAGFLLAVGLYGEVLPNQTGAPIRLVVPWKYGFKGIKGIVRMRFTEKMPPTSWNMSQPREYGFYANVNPEVDHPRWSQARERRIGSGIFAEKQPTLMFNGYGEQVAHLYKSIDLRRNF